MNYGRDDCEARLLYEKYISRDDAAKMIGLKSNTLKTWNSIGRYDEYFKKRKLCNRVYYDIDDVYRFLKDQLSAVHA